MPNVNKIVGSVIQQTSFNREGGLHVQKYIVSYRQTTEKIDAQATLDEWLLRLKAREVNNTPSRMRDLKSMREKKS